MRGWGLLVTLVLAACGPAAQQQVRDIAGAAPEAGRQAQQLDFSCAAFAGLTRASAPERFGAANISTETMFGPEGESYEATILYANDTARRLELAFDEQGRVASVTLNSPNTIWRGPGNVAIGASLSEIERANGGAFKLWGFDWDYGGWVSSWQDGRLARSNGCMIGVRFDATAPGAQGDGEFNSTDTAVRAAAPRVSVLGLSFSTTK